MSYELQVYALSPVRPTPREILARAGETGLALEMTPAPGAASREDDGHWMRLLLRAVEASRGGFVAETSPDLDRMKDGFRADRSAGENIPEQVLEAQQLYVLEIDDEAPAAEEQQAAFAVAAWALASLTEAILFDPQEEFFADAESFLAILMDEDSGDDEAGEDDLDDGPQLRVVAPPEHS
jgi:hypothetical protein